MALGAMRAIVDTGPLVAFFDRRERHHPWCAARIEALEAPLLVCEPVLTEAMHLLSRFPEARDTLLGFLRNGAVKIAFQLDQEVGVLRRLLLKYKDTPMSLADACVVRMAEIHTDHAVLTLDSDFTVYRAHGRAPLTLIYPGTAGT
jgi:predicted nucleic acid-binding protein